MQAPPPPNSSSAPTPAAAPPPASRVSFATFQSDDTVDECVEFGFSGDAEAVAEAVASIKKKTAKAAKAKATPIARACTDQFKGKIVLGTCTSEFHPDAGALIIRAVSRAYQHATLATHARQCLYEGGDWQGLDEDSDEFRRSRLHEHIERLTK